MRRVRSRRPVEMWCYGEPFRHNELCSLLAVRKPKSVSGHLIISVRGKANDYPFHQRNSVEVNLDRRSLLL